MEDIISKIKFNEQGLIPAILQDKASGEVLMLAYMNEASLRKTVESGRACFWSRSRQELWLKGETSGNYQQVEEIRLDCDNDTLLLLVKSAGPACHTGKNSCFYRRLSISSLEKTVQIEELAESGTVDSESGYESGVTGQELNKAAFLFKLYNLITSRREKPLEGSYTNYLFTEGVDKICKKVGEEAAEVIIGAKNESNQEIVYETSDLIYHLLVLLNLYRIPLTDILEELASRN